MTDLQLLKGDCLDLMPWLVSDESVDLTVTSPPYDSLRAYEGLPFEKFKKVAEEIYRVTKRAASSYGLSVTLPSREARLEQASDRLSISKNADSTYTIR
jgi:DNA modification methylase